MAYILNSPTFTGTVQAAALNASGIVNITNSTASTAYTNGSLIIGGGVGIAGSLFINGSINLPASTGIVIGSGAPGVTTNTLYQISGTLYFNGNPIGSGGATVTDDNSTNTTYYPLFDTTAGGSSSFKTSSTYLTWNPSTRTFTTQNITCSATLTVNGSSYIANAVSGLVQVGLSNNASASYIALAGYNTTTAYPQLNFNWASSGQAGIGQGHTSNPVLQIGYASAAGTWGTASSTMTVLLNSTTASSSYTTGALVVSGGVGIAGVTYHNSSINLAASTGIVIASGAPGVTANTLYQISGALYFNGTQLGSVNLAAPGPIGGTTPSSGAFTTLSTTTTSTVGTNLTVTTGYLIFTNSVAFYSQASILFNSDKGMSIVGKTGTTYDFTLYNQGITQPILCNPTGTNSIILPGNVSSTTTATGTLIVTGGVGISGSIYAGGYNGPIGAGTPNTATFTTATANTMFSGPLNGTVGATTPNTGAFTTLNSSSTTTVGTNLTVTSGYLIFTNAVALFTGGTVQTNATHGMCVVAKTGSTNDFILYDADLSTILIANPTGTNTIKLPAGVTSTTTTTGTLVVTGGVGISGDIFAGSINGPVGGVTPNTGAFTTLSTSSTATIGTNLTITTGYLLFTNNVALYTNGQINCTALSGMTIVGKTGSTYDFAVYSNGPGSAILANPTGTNSIILPGNIASTTATTGTLIVTGGAGISGALNIGGPLGLAASQGITIPSGAPSTTTNSLYNNGGSLYFNGNAVGFTRIPVADANYVIATTASVILAYTSISTARTLTLPAATQAGQIIWVVDSSGSVTSTNTITITRGGSDTIEGVGTTWVLNSAYTSVCLESNGAGKWAVLAYEEVPIIMADTNVTITNREDVIVIITSISAARTITLPAATITGQRVTVIDVSGSITTTNTVSINRAGSDSINAALTSYVLNVAYGYVELVASGTTKWNASQTPQIASGSSLSTSGAFALVLTTTAASTPTFPAGAGTLAYLGGTNTWTAAQTFSSTINKVTITAPTTSATLTLITGSTLATNTAASLTLGLSSAATSVITIPSGTHSLAITDASNTFTGAQTFSATSVHTLGATLTASASVSTAGYIGYNSTQLAHEFYASGLKQFNTTTMFVQTANGTNGSATTITNILGTGVGTAVLPANFFTAGKTIRVRIWGSFTTAATPGTTTFTLRFNAGTPVAVWTGTTVTLGSSLTNQMFYDEWIITARSTTSLMVTNWVTNNTMSAQNGAPAAATITAATSYTIEVDATNSVASGTIYTIYNATIEILA